MTDLALETLQLYTELKSALLQAQDAYAALERPDKAACLELRDKLAEGRFNVAALGQFKRGKSCLINALLGENLLPTASVPLTSVAVTVSYGESERVTVHFIDGSCLDIVRKDIAAYATETGNPRNFKTAKEIRVAFPAPLLKDGVSLLDTPGVGSVHRHNTDTAHAVLPRCDAALFLLSADQPLGQEELDYLHAIKAHARRIFFLLNKIDYLDPAELDESLAFTRRILTEAMGGEVKLFPISAKQALQGKTQGDPDLLERSRLPALAASLEAFLLHEKGKILLLSTASGFARRLVQARLEMRLEQQSAGADPAELDAKIAQFRRKRASLAPEQRRLRQHIQIDIRRIVEQVLDPAIEQCRDGLARQLPRRFDEFAKSQGGLVLRALDEALESFIQEELRAAFAAWQAQEEPRLAAEWEALGQRLGAQAAGLIVELQQFSADLLHVPYTQPTAADAWTPLAGYSLDFDNQPLGLDILAESAVLDWPGRISGRFPKLKAAVLRWAGRRIAARRREGLLDAIDRQSGRIRYALLECLEKAGARFAEEAWASVDGAAEGMAQALAQGRQERLMEASKAQQRRHTLDLHLAETERLQQGLESLRMAAETL